MNSKTFQDWTQEFNKLLGSFQMPGVEPSRLIAENKKNLDALGAANKRANEGLQELVARQNQILQESFAQMQSLFAASANGQGLQERLAEQADNTQKLLNKTLKDMKDVSDMVAKTSFEATEILHRRLNEALEDIKKSGKKSG